MQAELDTLAGNRWDLYAHSNLIEAQRSTCPNDSAEKFTEKLLGRRSARGISPSEVETIRDAYLHSIIWRKPTAFPPNISLDYLNSIEGSMFNHPVLDTLLEVACVPEHPLNARRLHEHLWCQTMPERDAWWSTYLQFNHEPGSPAGRLIEWAWRDDTSSCAADAALLCSISLAWFLTSSNRGVRDRASKALVALLRCRPPVLVELLRLFDGVNDPYVAERLYAVAYGYVLSSSDKGAIVAVAEVVYEQVFAAGNPRIHLLLRNYARGVVERALHLELHLPG